MEPTSPRDKNRDVSKELKILSNTSASLESAEIFSNYTASSSRINTFTDSELSAKEKFSYQQKKQAKQRILERWSRKVTTFIHQIDPSLFPECETEEIDTQVSSQGSADNDLEIEAAHKYTLAIGAESEVTSSDYDYDDENSKCNGVAEKNFEIFLIH